MQNLLRGQDANKAFHPPPAASPPVPSRLTLLEVGGWQWGGDPLGNFWTNLPQTPFSQPGPCSCRIMSCWQLCRSVSSSWVPLGSAQQLWQSAGAEFPPAGRRAPALSPRRTRCCCRWAKLPPGEQNFPQSGQLLLPRQLPSLSWLIPAEANVRVSGNAELGLSLWEERAGEGCAEVVLEDFGSLRAEQAFRNLMKH